MTTIGADIHVTGLGRQKYGELAARAKRLGMTPERYVRHLVDNDLAVAQEARTTTFQKLLGTGREVDEVELDKVVDRARGTHRRDASKKKR